MKAEFIIKAECIVHDAEERQKGEEVASFIKGLLRGAGIDAKVLIGNLSYDGEREVKRLERLRKGRSGNSK